MQDELEDSPYLEDLEFEAISASESPEDVIGICRQAFSIDPHCVWALKAMGTALVDLDQSQEAISVIERLLESGNEVGWSCGQIGNIYSQQLERPDLALPYFQKAMLEEPENRFHFLFAAFAAFHIRDMPEAARCFEGALVLAKDDEEKCEWREHLADIYLVEGNQSRALELAKELYDLGRNRANALCLMAQCHDLVEDQKAEAFFKAAIELEPSNAEFRRKLFFHYAETGELARGLEEIKKAAELEPDCPLSFEILHMAYRDLGDLPNARKAVQRAIELEPDCSAHYYSLHRIYAMENNPAMAALQLDLANKNAAEPYEAVEMAAAPPPLPSAGPPDLSPDDQSVLLHDATHQVTVTRQMLILQDDVYQVGELKGVGVRSSHMSSVFKGFLVAIICGAIGILLLLQFNWWSLGGLMFLANPLFFYIEYRDGKENVWLMVLLEKGGAAEDVDSRGLRRKYPRRAAGFIAVAIDQAIVFHRLANDPRRGMSL